MGSVQSQELCSKDSPKYRYHERVLQEAEAAFSDDSMAPAPAEAVKSDEQYYSADEGDSVCSLTPERTRPESSSAENSSLTSEDHDSGGDGSIDEDTSRDETYESSMYESDFLMSVDSLPNGNVGNEASRGNNHFNVQGQEHVQQSCKFKRHENSLVSLENKCRPGQITGCSNKDITTDQKDFTQSTGEPSATSQELHLIKNGLGSNQNVTNYGVSSEHKNNFLSPVNISSATDSFKRKRSRYPESSESESDCGRKEGHVNILKKRQKSKHHNRSRRSYRSSRFMRDSASDSDKLECGGADHCKRCACNSKSEGNVNERECVNWKCSTPFCQKKVDGYICDKNIADSTDTSCCYNMKNFQRPAVESSFADKIDSRQGSKCVHNCNHGGSDCVNRQQTRQQGTVPKLAELNVCDVYIAPVKDNVFSQNGNILTGEQRIIIGQDISSNHFQSCVMSKEQCSHTVEPLMHAPLHQKHHSNHDRQSASDIDFGVFFPLQKNTDSSTLTNVSAPQRMDSGCAQQMETFCIAGSSCVSEPIIQNTPDNSFCQKRQHESQNKKEQTAADKFMHLFSAAKKEIGSNIKCLFSKVTVTDKLSNKPNWQTYLSESSSANEACTGVRQRQEDYMAASDIQQSVDGQTAQVNSPLINQEHPSSPQSTRDSRILVSRSYSNNGESLVTSSLAAQNNCLHVGGTSPQVTAHSMSLRGSKQSLNIRSPSAASAQKVINNSADSLNKRGQTPCLSSNSADSLNKRGQSPSESDTCSVEWLPRDTDHQVLNCSLAGAICVSVNVGELGEQKTSGIVNWTDSALTHKVTRCSRSIASKAGALMWASCVDYIENKGSDLEAPDVLTTPAGGRFDKSVVAILHVVEPQLVGEDESSSATPLVEVYANCLRFANERLGLDSLSFPLIGEGTFPFDICLRSFFDALLVFLAEQTSSENCDLTKVQLIIPDINSASFAADLINSHLQNISSNDLYCVAQDTYNHHFGGRWKV